MVSILTMANWVLLGQTEPRQEHHRRSGVVGTHGPGPFERSLRVLRDATV